MNDNLTNLAISAASNSDTVTFAATTGIHGVWCLAFLIIVFGALGGLIFSLDSTDTHKLCLPTHRQGHHWDSGFLGHLFIGIGGAFVSITAAVPVFDLNLEIFDRYWSAGSDLNLLPITLYIVGISVLGGYSGLKIISGLSQALVKQLRKEFDEKTKDLKTNIESSSKQINHLEESVKRSEKENMLLSGAFLVESGDYSQGIDLLTDYLQIWPNEPKAWTWKGRAYKRVNQIDLAILAAKEAIKSQDDEWVYHYNLACYLTLKDQKISDEIINQLNLAIKYVTHEPSTNIKGIIMNDDDLLSIKDTSEYKGIIESL